MAVEVEVARAEEVSMVVVMYAEVEVDVLSYIMVDDEEYIMLEEELSQDEPLQP